MMYTILLISYASLMVISFLFNKRLSKLEKLFHYTLYYVPSALFLIIYFTAFSFLYLLTLFFRSWLFFRPMKLEDCPIGEENRLSTLLSPLDLSFQVSDEDFASADGLIKLKGEFSIAKFKYSLLQDFAYAKNSKGRLLYPKLTQVVKQRYLFATWEYHPDFNIENHVVEKWIDLKEEKEFRRFLTEMNLKRLPPHQPGFQFFVLHDKHRTQYTEDTMTYIVFRLDHTLGDGLTFVRIFMNSLAKPATAEDRTKLEALFKRFGKSHHIYSVRNLLLVALLSPIYLMDFIELEPANYFKNNKSSGRKYIALSAPQDFKKILFIKRRTNTTVNDVYTMLLGQALQAYMLEKGEKPDQVKFLSFLQAISLNVSLTNDMANNFVVVRFKIPLRILDWRQHLNEVHSAMLRMKTSLVPLFNMILVLVTSHMPKYLRIASQKMIVQSLVTGSFTNVPGPDLNMTLADVPVDGIAVFMPLTIGLSISASFLTYGQQLIVSISTDGCVCTEPEVILEHLIRKLNDIHQAVSPIF